MKLKEIDTKILLSLKGGESPDSIAQKLGLPKSTMYYHLGKLKKMGLVGGLKVNMDYSQVRGEKSTLILLSLNKTDNKSLQSFESEIRKNVGGVLSDMYVIGGGWDYLLTVHGTEDGIKSFLMDYLQALPNVARTHSLFILKHIPL